MVHRLIAKVDATGSADKRFGGGRPCTVRTTEDVAAVEAKTDLAHRTNIQREEREKLGFLEGNEVIIFSE